MPRVRAYVDTSVFGGIRDLEYSEGSRLFFERVEVGEFQIVMTDEILRELHLAPIEIRNIWLRLPPNHVEVHPVTFEMEVLAEQYIKAGILTRKWYSDALHVAGASFLAVDLIVSWNFRHIVNFRRISKFNEVNLANGYRAMAIVSPLEIVYGDREENEDI